MVLIAEIAEEEKKRKTSSKEEIEDNSEPPPPTAGAQTDLTNGPVDPARVGGAQTDLANGPVDPARGPYNEYALRVAYIMRNYLSMNQNPSAAASDSEGGAAEPRCRAMMEVIRKDGGKWVVTKIVPHHTHPLDPPPDPTGSTAGLIPVLGMEFEALSATKAFYSAYAEKLGFKCRAGAGRRSPDNRMLVMQKFFCSKGFYSAHKGKSEGLKRKRGKTEKKPNNNKNAEVVEVVDVDSSSEKDSDAMIIPSEELANGLVQGGVESENVDGKAMAMLGTPGQSRLLRELGIRVSKYTNEERRRIIMKYMQKRGNRQAVDRSVKIPSRQALAERRQRGSGGKFLSKQETQRTSPTQELQSSSETNSSVLKDKDHVQPVQDELLQNLNKKAVEEEPELPAEVVANAGGVPIVGIVFDSEEKACEYYVNYAGSVGFSVRKGWWDRSAKNITSRVYVCSREGFRTKNSTKEPRKIRSDPRTGCSARMAIKITSSGKYRITEFVPDHNHPLAAPLDIQMLKSQKLLATRQIGNRQTLSLIPPDYKNYLRSIRAKDMQVGDAGAILEYLQKQKGENPSFYYAIQVDEVDQMTNIFWADAKSIADYHYFGDVVCFDTSYKVNDYGRPLALFLGTNHHKQIIIFGAALLYDETLESFKWLFETFKTAMMGKEPKTILTDNDASVSDALAAVWPDSIQRVCVWYVYQNAVKHLKEFFHASESFAHDFGHCIYEIDDEEEFLSAWDVLLGKYNLKDNSWLAKLYEEKENWSIAYVREAFCADIQNTLRSESLNLELKEYLSSDIDSSHFPKQFDRFLEERRCAELQADYHANQNNSRIPPVRILWQAANAYTPVLFEMFRNEFNLFMETIVYACGEGGTLSEYQVIVKDKSKGHIVRFDSSNGSIMCTCKKYEYVGIQCCHVLKILDYRNIKDLPSQYILKRWRKDAKTEIIGENHDFVHNGDSRLSFQERYNSLCRALFKVAARAAENVETFAVMVSQSDQLIEQVEKILQTRLLEKQAVSNVSKGQTLSVADTGSIHHDSNGEVQIVNGKKKKDGTIRRKPQNVQEPIKRLKGRRDSLGQPEEMETAQLNNEPLAPPHSIPAQERNHSAQYFAPSHFMQAPYITGHQFGIGSTQGYTTPHFGQISSGPVVHQQQQIHNSVYLNQTYPGNSIHPLQYTATNPQLDQQSGDQAQSAIPVWDFL